MLYQLVTDLRMCSCEREGLATDGIRGGGGTGGGGDVSGVGGKGGERGERGGGVGSIKSIVTTVPVERVIAAGGDVCVALLSSKSATRPALSHITSHKP